jgi:hypothetical protein
MFEGEREKRVISGVKREGNKRKKRERRRKGAMVG